LLLEILHVATGAPERRNALSAILLHPVTISIVQ
jgi:hypothetical protein